MHVTCRATVVSGQVLWSYSVLLLEGYLLHVCAVRPLAGTSQHEVLLPLFRFGLQVLEVHRRCYAAVTASAACYEKQQALIKLRLRLASSTVATHGKSMTSIWLYLLPPSVADEWKTKGSFF